MPTPAEVIAMGVVMPVVDAAIVFLRFYARRGGKYGIDDFLVLFALVKHPFSKEFLMRGLTRKSRLSFWA